jgi:hypothetical protein
MPGRRPADCRLCRFEHNDPTSAWYTGCLERLLRPPFVSRSQPKPMEFSTIGVSVS